MSANEVLVELSKIARGNMADFIRAFFRPGDPEAAIDKLTPAQTAALVEVTVEPFMDGHGENASKFCRVRFKLANKIDALELLGKHHKLYVERHQHDWSVGLADRLNTALARVDGDREAVREQGDPYDHARAPPHEASGFRGRPAPAIVRTRPIPPRRLPSGLKAAMR